MLLTIDLKYDHHCAKNQYDDEDDAPSKIKKNGNFMILNLP